MRVRASIPLHKLQMVIMVFCHELNNIRDGATANEQIEELLRAMKTKERVSDIRKRLQLTLVHDAKINKILPEKVYKQVKK